MELLLLSRPLSHVETGEALETSSPGREPVVPAPISAEKETQRHTGMRELLGSCN